MMANPPRQQSQALHCLGASTNFIVNLPNRRVVLFSQAAQNHCTCWDFKMAAPVWSTCCVNGIAGRSIALDVICDHPVQAFSCSPWNELQQSAAYFIKRVYQWLLILNLLHQCLDVTSREVGIHQPNVTIFENRIPKQVPS